MFTRNDSGLADLADEHYAYGEDQQLIELARNRWPSTQTTLPEGIAEVCRLARLSCLRMSELSSDGDHARLAWLNQADALEARAFCAAAISGNRKTVAGLMLPRVHELVNLKAFAEGHQVLDAMDYLLKADARSSPVPLLFQRLIGIHRGYLYFLEKDYPNAARQYGETFKLAWENTRGPLVALANQALAVFMGSERLVGDVSRLRTVLENIRADALARTFMDVAESCKKNLTFLAMQEYDMLEVCQKPIGIDLFSDTRPSTLP